MRKLCADGFSITSYILGNIRLRTDCRLPPSEDSCFLESNFFPRVTEIIHMVEVDACKHRTIGIKNIDCVQSPAESHLQNRDVHLGSAEQLHRSQRSEFEISQGNAALLPG